jgi:hypothetical protein
MRTTLKLDDELLREAKKRAAASGKTMTQVIEEAIRESFLRSEENRKHRKRIELPVHFGGVLQPGVNLDDSAGLLAIMDGQ